MPIRTRLIHTQLSLQADRGNHGGQSRCHSFYYIMVGS